MTKSRERFTKKIVQHDAIKRKVYKESHAGLRVGPSGKQRVGVPMERRRTRTREHLGVRRWGAANSRVDKRSVGASGQRSPGGGSERGKQVTAHQLHTTPVLPSAAPLQRVHAHIPSVSILQCPSECLQGGCKSTIEKGVAVDKMLENSTNQPAPCAWHTW